MRENFYIYFLVDTLEFLQKGGRIGKASALFGSLLNIKPILSLDRAGEVAAIDKVRGHKKAVARILELLAADVSGKTIRSFILLMPTIWKVRSSCARPSCSSLMCSMWTILHLGLLLAHMLDQVPLQRSLVRCKMMDLNQFKYAKSMELALRRHLS